MKSSPLHAYRPDIDGLRAIAVLAVVLFHANNDLLRGGFIGVDIFFVISGYLITGVIAKGIEQNNFSFIDFYTRRIKRILPAYIVVALVTLAVSSYLLIPNDYIFYTTSLAASWAFASNIFFSMLSWGYFGSRTEEFPLLHTWSLSVEEQFYFIFPIVLILLYRYQRKQLVTALAGIALIFLIISEMKIGEVRSYFLLSSRAHELMIGALTYFASQRLSLPGKRAASLTAGLGLILVAASLVFINRGTPFPGINSLYPCMGAALIILAGRTGNPVSAVLASEPLVGVGLISYSLYLWHWPIFSFLRYRRIEMTMEVASLAILLAFVLAALTWKFVEQPVRENRKLGFKKAVAQYYALPAAAFLAIGGYSYLSEGAPARFSGEMRELISSYSFERDLGRTCSIRPEDYRKIDAAYLEKNCAYGDTSQEKPALLLIGDSHGNHFKPFMEQIASNAKMKGVFHVQGGCYPTEGAFKSEEQLKSGTTCEKHNADMINLAGNYKYVAIGGFWAWHDSPKTLENELEAIVKKIEFAGARAVILKDNAYFEPDPSQCILHLKRGWLPEGTNCNIPYEFVEKTQGPADRMIDAIASRHPDVIVIDPKKVMCNDSECLTHKDNMAFYKDANHINKKAAMYLGDRYVAAFGNPLLQARKPMPVIEPGHE